METATIDTNSPTAPTFALEGKQMGQRRALFPARPVPLPPAEAGSRLTLRDLISYVVRDEVRAFGDRQEERQVVRALTASAIAEGATRGKVDMGGARTGEPAVINDEAAVVNALLAFTDGLYYVFVDDQQIESLDAEVRLRVDARVTFLRLVALAGG